MSAPQHSDEAMPFRSIGRYEMLCYLARGGMASVYLARARGHAGFERLVAIKTCHAHLRDSPEFTAMFLDEARLAARIHHPNVVPTVDLGADPLLHMVMEYVDGERLYDVVKQTSQSSRQVPVPIILRMIVDALRGLHAVHELCDAKGQPLHVVHRDISPQNIMVGVDGVTRIMDFGIAKTVSRSIVTRDGSVKGKLGYMAPEQIEPTGEVDRRVDVFAAGVVLWEALTSRRLFRGASDAETVALILRGAVPKVADSRADVTPDLEAIVARSLARTPDERFATASDFADALEALSVKVAPASAVARYVADSMTTSIALRRDRLARALEQPSAPLPVAETPNPLAAESTRTPEPAPRNQRPRSWLAGVTTVIAAGLAAILFLRERAARTHEAAVQPGPSLATHATSTAAVSTPTSASPQGPQSPPIAVAPSPTPPPPAPTIAPARSAQPTHTHRAEPVRAHTQGPTTPTRRERFEPAGI